MVYSTFYSNNKPLSIKGLFMLFFLMPCFVYGQSEAELQEQMSVLYQKANKMYKALPQKDYRGFYFRKLLRAI